jgi:hypothetical protein
LKWHFVPPAACLFITFTFGGSAWLWCCFCLPFFFAGADKIGGESAVRMLLLLLLVLSSSEEEIALAGVVVGYSSPEKSLAQHGQRMSLPMVSCISSALGCRKLEQIPWNCIPQMGQRCWLASTDSSGKLQNLQHFTMLQRYSVIIVGITVKMIE